LLFTPRHEFFSLDAGAFNTIADRASALTSASAMRYLHVSG